MLLSFLPLCRIYLFASNQVQQINLINPLECNAMQAVRSIQSLPLACRANICFALQIFSCRQNRWNKPKASSAEFHKLYHRLISLNFIYDKFRNQYFQQELVESIAILNQFIQNLSYDKYELIHFLLAQNIRTSTLFIFNGIQIFTYSSYSCSMLNSSEFQQ